MEKDGKGERVFLIEFPSIDHGKARAATDLFATRGASAVGGINAEDINAVIAGVIAGVIRDEIIISPAE